MPLASTGFAISRPLFHWRAAVSAVCVFGPDGRFAMPTGRVKAVAAVRTVVEAGVHHGLTLRALGSYGISHQEIDDEPDRVGDENNDNCPQRAIHSAPSGIAVYVPDHQS